MTLFPKPEKKPKKRKTRAEAYMTARNAYLQAHPTCEICEVEASTEVHHRAGRRGSKLMDETDWMALCNDCHRKVHEYPSQSYENGWLKKRNAAWDG